MKYAIVIHYDDTRTDEEVAQQIKTLRESTGRPVQAIALDTNPAAGPKRMHPAEFRRLGLLQEINRLFLHPAGLALEMSCPSEDNVHDYDNLIFSSIWDSRDDPEGFIFALPPDQAKAEVYDSFRRQKEDVRSKKFGWIIQPAESGTITTKYPGAE